MNVSKMASRLLGPLVVMLLAGSASAHQHDYFRMSGNGANAVPPNSSTATTSAIVTYGGGSSLRYYIEFSGLSGTQTAARIHGYAPAGQTAPVLATLALGSPVTGSITVSSADAANIRAGLAYVSIETSTFPAGEVRGQIEMQMPVPWVHYCLGDGSASACPCGNNAPAGFTGGCVNSLGGGAFASGHGASSVTLDFLGLEAEGLPATSVAALYQGTAHANGGVGTPFGDGLQCVGGTMLRIQTLTAAAGEIRFPSTGFKLSLLGNITAGDVRFYQVRYRNSASFCTPSGFNSTEALEVTWLP